MTRRILSTDQRAFLNQVRDIIYLNPFSVFAEDLERMVEGARPSPDEDHHFGPVGLAVNRFLEPLDAQQRVHLSQFSAADGELLSHSLLFQVYHHFVTPMDRHIADQLDRPERPLVVAFADDMLRELQQRGIPIERAVRYLAIFFQLRRAFFFIDEALIGKSTSMRRLRSNLWSAVFSNDASRYDRFLWNRMEDFSILLNGPTGSGKGAAATAIGRAGFIPYDVDSRRFTESFTANVVQANLSEYSENLIESALFGHRKGAFTGAVEKHVGLFQRCSPNGTLFLDEIGDLSPPVQVKLLRVLQERTFTAVGGHETLRFSGRLITATHRDLDERRANGAFRDDLYYRLSSLVIDVPSLSERVSESPDELPLMIDLLVSRTIGRDEPQLSAEVCRQLDEQLPGNYGWPGNVRELEQAVRRTLLAIPFKPSATRANHEDGSAIDKLIATEPSVRELLADYCGALYARYGSYEEVARRTGLDRRTVKKHLGD